MLIIVERKAPDPVPSHFISQEPGADIENTYTPVKGPGADIKITFPPTHHPPPTHHRKLFIAEMGSRDHSKTFLLRGNFFITQPIKRYSKIC